MKMNSWHETFVEQQVTYTLFKDGNFHIIENVPARLSVQTGEQLFSPETVEKLHHLLLGKRPPVRFVQTPVYEFA